MQFLSKEVDLYERPLVTGCVGNKVGRSRLYDPVRVLDCVPDFSDIPGGVTDNAGAIYHLAEERAAYLRDRTLDLVQVGHPPSVGFALVPRSLLTDTPF